MNPLQQLFQEQNKSLLNIFFTAGYPYLNATADILLALQNTKCNLIEVGIPFSDPVSDGPIIQTSSTIALKNGMNIEKMFEQIATTKNKIKTPVILMGYLNPVLQFGIEAFLKKCVEAGISGTILPDLPIEIYQKKYLQLFNQYNISNVFLITPETTLERIKMIDSISNSFIYVLSASATTGKKINIKDQHQFFKKLKNMKLKNPYLIGFGIQNKQDFMSVCEYSNGGIIGSAFINYLEKCNSKNIQNQVQKFVHSIK